MEWVGACDISITYNFAHCRCEAMLKTWSGHWESVSKRYVMLDVRDDPDFFRLQQPVAFGRKYDVCVACELDGTVVKHDKSRRHSVKARCSYCDKW